MRMLRKLFDWKTLNRVQSLSVPCRSVLTLTVAVLASLILCTDVHAVPYVGNEFTYYQPDGEAIQVRLYGDEFYAVAETLDGQVVVKDPVTGIYQYADLSTDGTEFQPTGIRVGKSKKQGAAANTEKERIGKLKKKQRINRESREKKADAMRKRLGRDQDGRHLLGAVQPAAGDTTTAVQSADIAPAGITGSRVTLVLLAKFSDRAADVTLTQTQVNNAFNAVPHTEFNNATSVKGYFRIQSNNKLELSSVVTAYFTAKNNRDYYTDPAIGYGSRARELLLEGLEVLKAQGFNFAQLDGDGDGRVDTVSLLYAGSTVNAWSEGLWPHASSVTWAGFSAQGLSTSVSYQITNLGNTLAIGTICHELGHAVIKFPDLYSYDGNAASVGNFCLMAGGNWASGGRHPTSICGPLKYDAGWTTVQNATSSTVATYTLSVDQNSVVRFTNPTNSGEYFMAEIRSNTGYEGPYGGDTASICPSKGLVVFHCLAAGSNTRSSIFTTNNPNCNYSKPYRHLLIERNPVTAYTPWYDDPSPDGGDAFVTGDSISSTTKTDLKFWSASGRTVDSGATIHSINVSGSSLSFKIGATVNRAPVANAQNVTTVQNTAKAITLAGSDPDGDAITYTIVTQPAHGTLSGTGSNKVYTPAANYSGSDSFTFIVTDSKGAASAAAAVSITVAADVMDVTIASDNGYEIYVNGVLTGAGDNWMQAQTYADIGLMTGKNVIAVKGIDAGGVAALLANIVTDKGQSIGTGSGWKVSLNPPANWKDVAYDDSAWASASDGGAYGVAPWGKNVSGMPTNTAARWIWSSDNNAHDVVYFRYVLTVGQVNRPPVANAQSVTTAEDTARAITLSGSDPDGDALTYTIVTQPAKGSLSGTAPNMTYTPAANYSGTDSFTFRVNDGKTNSANATVSISVSAVNDAPVANAQNVTTAEDTAKAITLSGSDPDGNALTYAIVTQPAKGTLSGTAPNVTYTPSANYNGNDSFTFLVNDGAVNSAAATVAITVSAVNDAPVATAQSVSTVQNTAKAITLTGSDVDGDTLTYTVVTHPSNGTLAGTVPNVTYTPASGYSGSDSFVFKVTDSKGAASANATVSITVTAIIGGPAGYIWCAGESGTTVFTNTVDVAYGANGVFSYKYGVSGSIIFNPATFGGDPVPNVVKAGYYRVVGTAQPGLLAHFYDYTSGLSALPDLTGKTPDVTRTDAQVNYASVDTVWAGLPASMTDTFASRHTGKIRINTAGNYTFYLSSDDGSKLWLNDQLLINNDGIHGMVEASGTVTLTAGTHDLRIEFFENAGGAGLVFSWAGPGIAKQVVPSSVLSPLGKGEKVWIDDAAPAGAALSGTWNWITTGPVPYSGTKAHRRSVTAGVHQHYFQSATETLSVGAGDVLFCMVYLDPASMPSEVMLQWNNGNWEHRAYWGSNSIAWGTDGTVSRRYMGALPAAGQWVRLEVPAALVGLENSTLSGMAFTLYNGSAVFDRAGVAAGIPVPANNPPVATAQSVTTPQNTAKAITLSGSDPDGDALTYTIVTQPAKGTLSGTAPNVTYTPAGGTSGIDSFVFKVTDSKGAASGNATVSIAVSTVNSAPVANAQSVTMAQNTIRTIILTGSDPDGDTLTYTIVTQPARGTLSGTAPNLIYTPSANYSGSDSFVFKVTDSKGASSANATVSISVTASQVNVVLPANGGKLLSYTSQYGSGFLASDLTDGTTTDAGWSSAKSPKAQSFVYSFKDGQSAALNNAVIYTGSAEGAYWSKNVEVWTSSNGGSSYTKRASATLANKVSSTSLNLNGVVANRVKLVITSGYRTDYWELGEFVVNGSISAAP